MKYALVTGSSGLVGSETSLFFSKKKFKILGIDNINELAIKFGFGNTYLNDMFNSSSGLVPSKNWKKKKLYPLG